MSYLIKPFARILRGASFVSSLVAPVAHLVVTKFFRKTPANVQECFRPVEKFHEGSVSKDKVQGCAGVIHTPADTIQLIVTNNLWNFSHVSASVCL